MPDTSSTKMALAASMKQLMEKKDFSKISVGEICETCGINRKSFYYHFRDKYDLVNWIYYVDFLEHIHVTEDDNGWTIFSSICHYFYSEAAFYRNALKIEGQNSFRDYFYETLAAYLRYFLQDIYPEEDQQKFSITFFCDAYYSAICRWLTAKDIMPVDEFLEHIRKILNTSAELVIKNRPTLPLDPDGHLSLNQVSESGMAQDNSIDTENHFNTKNTRD